MKLCWDAARSGNATAAALKPTPVSPGNKQTNTIPQNTCQSRRTFLLCCKYQIN